MTLEQFGLFFGSAFRLAMPLMLAGIGELVSETSGVLNLSLEGMMLSAALGGALASWATGMPAFGLACGIFVALLVALWQAFMSVTLRADQIVVGIGFNLLALGGTMFVYREVLGASSNEQIPGFAILGGQNWSDAVPILGPALLHQTGLFYIGLLLIVATWAVISGTSFGLNLRAVGEDQRHTDALSRCPLYGSDGRRGRLLYFARRCPHLHRGNDEGRGISGARGRHFRILEDTAHSCRVSLVRRGDRASVPLADDRHHNPDGSTPDAAVCSRAARSCGTDRSHQSARRFEPSVP
jgi:hypothetical protein